MARLQIGRKACDCGETVHQPRLVAVTGGPGAGKTALLELARHAFCEHVAFLPEAASVVFGGGFPRHDTEPGLRAAQRAIFQVQRQMEQLVLDEHRVAVALCDRGTLDGVAYWPGDPHELWAQVGSSRAAELVRYQSVIHLRTPSAADGYNLDYALRVESAEEAARLDERILAAWQDHASHEVIPSHRDFATKARRAFDAVRAALPPCCHAHRLH